LTSYSAVSDVTNNVNMPFSSSTTPTDTQVTGFIADADAFIDGFCGHNWLSNSVTQEYYDAKGYGPQAGIVILKNAPVTAISLVEWWDGHAWETAVEGYPNQHPGQETYVTYLPEGKILFHKLRVDGPKMIRVTYTWGYSSVPAYVKHLSSVLAALTVLAYLSGPLYQSYRVGNLNYTYPKEGPYAVQWNMLVDRAQRLMWQLTRRPMAGVG
jgi:hypothetical protein